MIGDLPEADAAPPSNMVFVCKLNAVGGAWGQPQIAWRLGRILCFEVLIAPAFHTFTDNTPS